VQEQSMIYC